MQSDGSQVRVIETPELRDTMPILSHDGSKVTFTSHNDDGGLPKLYVAATDGSVLASLMSNVAASSISGNGEWLAFGVIPPEWDLWDLWRSKSDGSVASYVFPCGMGWHMERQLSADGSRMAWSCPPSFGGFPGLFTADWNLPNLKISGPVKLGKSVALHVNGGASEPVLVFLAPLHGSLPAPPYGTLGLDVSTMIVLALANLDATGTLTLGGVIPNDPSLVGAHAYLQAISGSDPLVVSGKLTNTLDLEVKP